MQYPAKRRTIMKSAAHIFGVWTLVFFTASMMNVSFAEDVNNDGKDKNYLIVGGLLMEKNGTKIPVMLVKGIPFSVPNSLTVEGTSSRPITINIVDYDKQKRLFVPSDDSLIPRSEPAPDADRPKQDAFCVQAENITWIFAKAGIKFETDDATYVSEKADAKISFTKDGVILEGIKTTKQASKNKPPSKGLIIEVDKSVSDLLANLPKDVVFFTSASAPIKSFDEIQSGEDVGICTDYTILDAMKELFSKQNKKSDGMMILGRGMAGDPTSLLFKNYPKMKLFVTREAFKPDASIGMTGKRVTFVEKSK
jgi:hypothetical protein